MIQIKLPLQLLHPSLLPQAAILPFFTPPSQPPNSSMNEASEMDVRKARTNWGETLLLGSMCAILCCVTGSEHSVATWLALFGVEVGGLSEETSEHAQSLPPPSYLPLRLLHRLDYAACFAVALMSSFFWGSICTGRLVWCVASELITTAWPMLFADLILMLSGVCLFSPNLTTPLPLRSFTASHQIVFACDAPGSLAFLAYTLAPAGHNQARRAAGR